MAKEVTQAPDASETDAAKAAGPARKDRKSLYLTGGLVALTALAWGLSVMAVPGKEKEVRHLLAGPFVASISPQILDSARDFLARTGFDPLYGARPLARIIQEHVKKPLAEELLFGKLQAGGLVRVDLGPDNKLVFTYPDPMLPPGKKPKLPALVE